MAFVVVWLAVPATKAENGGLLDDASQGAVTRQSASSSFARADDHFPQGFRDTVEKPPVQSDTAAGGAETRELALLATTLFEVPMILLMCVLLIKSRLQGPVKIGGACTVEEVGIRNTLTCVHIVEEPSTFSGGVDNTGDRTSVGDADNLTHEAKMEGSHGQSHHCSGFREGPVVCKMDGCECNGREECGQKAGIYIGKCDETGADSSSASVGSNSTLCGSPGVAQGSAAIIERAGGTNDSPLKAGPDVFVLSPRALPETFALTPRTSTPRSDVDDAEPEVCGSGEMIWDEKAPVTGMEQPPASQVASQNGNGEASDLLEVGDQRARPDDHGTDQLQAVCKHVHTYDGDVFPELGYESASPDDQASDQLQGITRRASSKRRRRSAPRLLGCLGGCSVAVSSIGDAPAAMVERHGQGACCLPVTCAAIVTGCFYRVVIGLMNGIYSALGEEPIQVTLERGAISERITLPTILENEELDE